MAYEKRGVTRTRTRPRTCIRQAVWQGKERRVIVRGAGRLKWGARKGDHNTSFLDNEPLRLLSQLLKRSNGASRALMSIL